MIDKNYRFKLNVSKEGYEKKTDAIACLSRAGSKKINRDKMCFFEMDLTVDEMLCYVRNGHTFCGLFEFDPNKQYVITEGCNPEYPIYKKGTNKGGMKLSFKSDTFFKGSQVIFVDVDYTSFTDLDTYCEAIRLKPTFAYPTYSDNVDKHGIVSRRFRLVYVFHAIIEGEKYVDLARRVHKHVEDCTCELMDDDCGTRRSQYMNGTFNVQEVYLSYDIHYPFEFPELPQIAEEPEDKVQVNGRIEFDDSLIQKMNDYSYEDFMHRHSKLFRYVYRTERAYWDRDYQLTGEGFLKLWWYNEKVQDGNHRRRKLFMRACLRRLMYPDIDPDTLLFNLYVDREKFFDNSDGVLTIDVLKRKAKKAMEMSEDELEEYCSSFIEYWKVNRPKFIFKNGMSRSLPEIKKLSRELLDYDLMERYDRQLSVKENFDNGVGQGCSLNSLYRFCSRHCIPTNPNPRKNQREVDAERKRKEKEKKKDLFIMLYDRSKSVRWNQENMSKRNLNLSTGTIQKWKDKYIKETDSLFGMPFPQMPTPTPPMGNTEIEPWKRPRITVETPWTTPNNSFGSMWW